jgi:hypothetical protein
MKENQALLSKDPSDNEIVDRPRRRGECVGDLEARMKGETVCPFVGCKYNTYLRVNKDGSLKIPDYEVTDMKVSNCVLDYTGGTGLLEISRSMGITPQAIEHAQRTAIKKILESGIKIDDFSIPEHREGNLAQAQDYAFDKGQQHRSK